MSVRKSPSALRRALFVKSLPRAWRAGLAAGLTIAVLSTSAVASSSPAANPDAPMRILSGWVPFWNGDRGPQGMVAMGPLTSAISPFIFDVVTPDRIERRGSPDINARMRQASVAAKVPLVPTMFDATDNGVMAATLANPEARTVHVNTIVQTVLDGGYDGIDLDYENFAFEDGYDSWETTRPLWVEFIHELGDALHAYAKLLFATIPSTYADGHTKAAGYWVYDPKAIAPYVDRIRIMAYDYSWTSLGPNAPLAWTQTIVDWAAANLPKSKVELGVPLYGRDWITSVTGTCPGGVRTRGRVGIRTERAIALAVEKAAVPQRQVDGEMRFDYTATYTGPYGPPEPDPGDGGTGGPDPLLGGILLPPGFGDPVDPNAAGDPAVVGGPTGASRVVSGGETPPASSEAPPSTESPVTLPPTSAPPSSTPRSTQPSGPTLPPNPSTPPATGGTVTCTMSRTVYYPDAGTSVLKAQQVAAAGLAGIVFFAIGYEEPSHFMGLTDVAARIPHAPGVDPIGDFDITPDGPSQFHVKGWALDPETSLPIILRVSVDGQIRKQVLANGDVPALETQYPGNGPFHGVDLSLTHEAGRHRVCVQAIGMGAGTTVRWLTCTTVDISA